MKAAVLHGPGDVRLEEVAEPVPRKGEIVVRTLAAFTCGTDRKVARRGYHAKMLTPPCVFGHEGAGEVAEIGEGVISVKPGDRVVAANSAPCGRCRLCLRGRESLCPDLVFWNGVFAEKYLVPAPVVLRNLLPLGDVPAEDAAMTEPLACCVKGVAEAAVGEDDRVLIIGAGSIGLMLTSLCALKGAQVTTAARRRESVARALEHGAKEVSVLESVAPGLALGAGTGGFDVVFDAAGAAETASLAIRSVARGGRVSLFAGCPAATLIELDVTRVHYDEITIVGSFHHTPEAFREAFHLIASRQIVPTKFVTARKALAELPQSLIAPQAGELKTLVLLPPV